MTNDKLECDTRGSQEEYEVSHELTHDSGMLSDDFDGTEMQNKQGNYDNGDQDHDEESGDIDAEFDIINMTTVVFDEESESDSNEQWSRDDEDESKE